MPKRTPYPRHKATPRTGAPARRAYDCVVVGGGPAGLSAAIYLARYNRSVLVVDAGSGRSTSHETNQNYLGFPRGITSQDLRDRGCAQAVRFGAEILDGRVTSIARTEDGFTSHVGRRRVRSSTVLLATGVTDSFDAIDNAERYVGASLFWCITCDGWKTRGKRIAVVGNSDDAATTALQFLNFTPHVQLVTNAARTQISARKRRALERSGIPLIRAKIARVAGRGRQITAVHCDNGDVLRPQLLFNSQGSEPNAELARDLRLKLVGGYVWTEKEQRTSAPGVYAAGDVTRLFAHQVVTAAHEGATAGQAINYDLYRPEQRA